MAIKITTPRLTPITVKEMVSFPDNSQYLDKLRYSHYQTEEMELVASRLRALAANRQHILQTIITELQQPSGFQFRNKGQSQSFVLHRSENYTLRLMLWIPDGHQARSIPFSYEGVHDHFFDLMSVGLFGPGYRTSLYSFDRHETIRRYDGLTRLNYHGDMWLQEGEVIYYYANEDVHLQHPPASLSLSLNLIIIKSDTSPSQTIFDLDGPADNKVVWGRPRFNSRQKFNTQRSIFSTMLKHGDADSRHTVLQIALESELEEVRALLAWVALLKCPSPEPRWYEELAKEKSTFVRDIVTMGQQ